MPRRSSTASPALYLLAIGNTLGGVVILVFGSVLLFVADHFVRPFLIGGAARLPFLLVLLGILGGLETMGFLGLFLGPATMAALIALWREWTEPAPRPSSRPRGAGAARRGGRGRAASRGGPDAAVRRGDCRRGDRLASTL